MRTGFLAELLMVDVEERDETLDIHYTIDRRATRTIAIPVVEAAPAVLELLTASTAIYLGSLCLARQIRVTAPLHSALLDDLIEIAGMIYDIRRWRDQLPLDGPPALTADRECTNTAATSTKLSGRRSTVLWSGGKDSTLALLTLQANDYAVHPLHLNTNAGAEASERRATQKLLPLLGLTELDERAIEHEDFLELSNSYANSWDSFPLSNCVPFGRDLLLAAIAVAVALQEGAGRISMGHDHDCRTAEVSYGGRRIPRNDLESSRAAISFENAVRRHLHPELRLLPPIARLPELRILRDMFVDYPQLMRNTSFCFWGSNCGRCGKCLRYFLADRLYNPGLIEFEANPLHAGACPELSEILGSRDLLFQKEVMVLMGRLAEQGDIRDGEEELDSFRRTRLTEVRPYLDLWETELLGEHEDPQVPEELRPASSFATSATFR